MAPSRTLYESEDEHEVRALVAYLAENDVVCTTVYRTETAYPGVFGHGAKHSIHVAEEAFDRAEELVADFVESEAHSIEGGPYREDAVDAAPDERIDDAMRRALIGERIARTRMWLVMFLLMGSLTVNFIVFLDANVALPIAQWRGPGGAYPLDDEDPLDDESPFYEAVDADEDGLLDVWRLRTGAEARDTDGDGFPDVIACVVGAPTPRVDLAACVGSSEIP